MPVTVAERSKACTVFTRSEQGSWVRIPLSAWMFSVRLCMCVFLCCVEVETLRRADHPPKESYRMFNI
jgi:hypothetical protein